jgi:hypothetical protein
MIVGFGRERLTPPTPFDPQGFSARDRAVAEVDPNLSVTACVIRGDGDPAVIVSADVLAHTRDFTIAARRAIARELDCRPENVLLNATHTHASVWPGPHPKISGESLDRWFPGEHEFLEGLSGVYAAAARSALDTATEARMSWSLGRVPGRSVNRRERTASGQVVMGWNRIATVDDTVTALRFDEPSGRTIGLIVGFACHPVVLGHQVARASSDFVGPLRSTVESLQGGLCLFLQGASGDVQPREALYDARGPEEELGRRIGLEAVHAVTDADPWPKAATSIVLGRWTPTVVYRPSMAGALPGQPVAVASRTIELPLQPPPPLGELRAELKRLESDRISATSGATAMARNGIINQIRWIRAVMSAVESDRVEESVVTEVWVARIGPSALLGVSAELFGEIGAAIRGASRAESTFVAGCCNGVLGYVPSAGEFPAGGFEVSFGHRVYGLPGAVSPTAGAQIVRTATELIDSLFPCGGTP